MREITLEKVSSFEELEARQLDFWLRQSLSAKWDATFELVEAWCDLHGVPLEERRVKRECLQRVAAPWIKQNCVRQGDV